MENYEIDYSNGNGFNKHNLNKDYYKDDYKGKYEIII